MDIKNLKLLNSYTNEYQVSHQKVVKLLEDDNNCIWASTYSGLTVYNTTNNTIRFINKNHGIYNTEYNYKSGCKLKNGNLAFGGLNSHEIINPNSLSEFKYVTKFLISGVEVIENETKKILKKYVEGQKLSFNTGKETLKIYLGNLDYQYEGGYTYEYCLDTLNWQKITSKNFILISNLSYGDYILKIRMFNPFGEIVEEKQVPLIANVPFYVTTTFYVIIILLVIILSALFIKFIVRSEKIEAETKAKIAMDLHDESGTILTRLLMLTRREKFEDKEKEHLQNGLKEVLFNFRTYLNSISRTKLTLIDLFDELRDFTNSYCRQAGIDVEFINHYDKNLRINNELYKDLKLAIYEIVTNCIKHSNADKVSLSFNAKRNNLDIVVTDTGKCDINNLEGNKGNGIRNTKKRISRNKGTIIYSNAEGANGLMIKIKIPI
jgi:two-component sensor histidine kinase